MAIEKQKKPVVSFVQCKDAAAKCSSNLLVYAGGIITREEFGEMDVDRWGINGGLVIDRDLAAVASDKDLQRLKNNLVFAHGTQRCSRKSGKKDVCYEIEYIQDMLNAELIIRANVINTIQGFRNTVDSNIRFKRSLINSYRHNEQILNKLIDDFPRVDDDVDKEVNLQEAPTTEQENPAEFTKFYFCSRPFLQTFFDSYHAIKFSYNCHIDSVLVGKGYGGWFAGIKKWAWGYNQMYWLEGEVDQYVSSSAYSPQVSSDKREKEYAYKKLLKDGNFSNKNECSEANRYLKENFAGGEKEHQWAAYSQYVLHSGFILESKELLMQTHKLSNILAQIIHKDSLMSNLRTDRLVKVEVPAIKKVIDAYNCDSLKDKDVSEFRPADYLRRDACQEMNNLLQRASHQAVNELWDDPSKFWPRGKYYVAAPSVKYEGYDLYLKRLDRLQLTQIMISNLEANIYTYNLIEKDLHCEDLESTYNNINKVTYEQRVNYCLLLVGKQSRANRLLEEERSRFKKLDERIVNSVSGGGGLYNDTVEFLEWHLNPFVAKCVFMFATCTGVVLGLWGSGKLLSYASGYFVGIVGWDDLWNGIIDRKDRLIAWVSNQFSKEEQTDNSACKVEKDDKVSSRNKKCIQSDEEYYECMKLEDVFDKPSLNIQSTSAQRPVDNTLDQDFLLLL